MEEETWERATGMDEDSAQVRHVVFQGGEGSDVCVCVWGGGGGGGEGGLECSWRSPGKGLPARTRTAPQPWGVSVSRDFWPRLSSFFFLFVPIRRC